MMAFVSLMAGYIYCCAKCRSLIMMIIRFRLLEISAPCRNEGYVAASWTFLTGAIYRWKSYRSLYRKSHILLFCSSSLFVAFRPDGAFGSNGLDLWTMSTCTSTIFQYDRSKLERIETTDVHSLVQRFESIIMQNVNNTALVVVMRLSWNSSSCLTSTT